MNRAKNAWTALSWGLTFLVYAGWLAYDHWRSSKKIRSDTVARLVATDAASKADEMRRGEFFLPRENVEIEP